MSVEANCRRISAHCRVCHQDGELLEAVYHAVDRNGDPIYPAKCCRCGGFNIICPLPGTKSAVVSSLDEIPPELAQMIRRGIERFGFVEGAK